MPLNKETKLNLGEATSLGEEKLCIKISSILFKNWPCVVFCLWLRALKNIYIYIYIYENLMGLQVI